MAIYRTTDTELTSIADAIRAKTGDNSSLVYPTGFVSAIQGISTGQTVSTDGLGLNPELVSTLFSGSVLLKNTDYSTWTPSGTAAIIVPQSDLTATTINLGSYDYAAITDIVIPIVYKEGTTVINGPTECYFRGMVLCGRRASSVANLASGTLNYNSYVSLANSYTLYKNGSGADSIYYGDAAIYSSGSTPVYASVSSDTPSITFRTPVIRAVTSTNYMTATMADAIDQDKTVLYLTTKLYRYQKGTTIASTYFKANSDMYIEQHTS